jgi:hypothetical protein
MSETKTLQQLLDKARRQIEVSEEELAEARRRRGLLEAALREEFPGCRVYLNGSVAHGDALTPLTDVDIGGVAFDGDDPYGPGKEGPRDPMERARDAIKRRLGEEFPKLRVMLEGQRRAVLVSFGDPVTPGTEDFTADAVIGVDNESGVGIFIPNLPANDWDPSAPEQHTAMVRAANERSRRVYARSMRLLKFWNQHHGEPVCSWLLKALGLPSITSAMPLADALQAFRSGRSCSASTRRCSSSARRSTPSAEAVPTRLSMRLRACCRALSRRRHWTMCARKRRPASRSTRTAA